MRIALATAADQAHTDQDDAPLLAALAAAGHEASLVPWDDPDADWGRWDAVLIRSTWDYHTRRDAFVDWACEVGGRTRLFNDAEVVRWNTHKSYLIELEERGAPIVPTAWLARGDRVDLAALAAARGWDEVVLKPAVGAGGDGIERLAASRGQTALDALSDTGDVLVQPFLPSIATAGELSVILFGGRVSHAVRKRPAAGAYLVQVEHGGVYEPVPDVPAEAAELAHWVVEATGQQLLYARVDLLVDAVGTWQVNELEVTEPNLFMDLVEGSAERLVRALEHAVG